MKKNQKVPYRFTCPIPCEVVGHREMTKEEEEEFKKTKEILKKEFNLGQYKDNLKNEDTEK